MTMTSRSNPVTETQATRRQDVLDFVQGFIVEQGYSPSIREIMDAVGCNSSYTIACDLMFLAEKGHLRRADFQGRGLSLPPEHLFLLLWRKLEADGVDPLRLALEGINR